MRSILKEKFSKYHFQIRHVTAILTVLILFQIILAFVQKSAMNDFLSETQNWYQKYSADKLATVTTTSLELLYENFETDNIEDVKARNKIITSVNVVFKQQLIQKNVKMISLILVKNHKIYLVDSGAKLYDFFTNTLASWDEIEHKAEDEAVVDLFLTKKESMKRDEIIYSSLTEGNVFNILVPFVPDGEYLGVMYMKIQPDFTFLTDEIGVNFNTVTIIYSTLILAGLLIIYIVSSQAVKERNETEQILFNERETSLKKQIRQEKESLFTKRIYHTHHKAEKIMGFIKSDVRTMNTDNLDEYKQKVITYSNFISRIIYDMKWYDQDLNTIIGQMFQTDINKVLNFIIDNVFLRISRQNEMFTIERFFSDDVPIINVNEFIVWEIFEPIIQNSIDHGKEDTIVIRISTEYNNELKKIIIKVADDGKGILKELLEEGENGIKKIFLENITSKRVEGANSGYGCYIAYQLAVTRCGWELDVNNLNKGGCEFTFKINA